MRPNIAALPWPKITKLVDAIITRRKITFHAFAVEIGMDDPTAHKWIRGNREPKRDNSLKVIAWCEKHGG